MGLRHRACAVGGWLLVALTCCGGSEDKTRTPTGARASCQADDECVLTDKGTGCCTACAEAPHAIPKLTFEQRENRCAAAACGPVDDRIECAKVEKLDAYIARCKDGTCAAVKR